MNFRFIVFVFALLAAFMMPFWGMVLGASSMAAGLLPVLVLLPVMAAVAGPPNRHAPLALAKTNALAVLAMILSHGALSATHDAFDRNRFLASYLYLLCFVAGSLFLGRVARAVPDFVTIRALRIVAGVLVACSVAGAFGYSPFHPSVKAVLFFSEPSGFAQVAAPYLLFFLVTLRGRQRGALLVCSYLAAVALESLTLVFVTTVAGLLTFRPRDWLWAAPFGAVAALSLGSIDFTYYTSRLNLSRASDNLSALAYLQGWERAMLNVTNSRGFGVGFQQFGIVGDVGTIQQQMEEQGAGGLNLLDGSFVASKFIGEFGVFGVIALCLYLRSWLRWSGWLRRVAGSGVADFDQRTLFFACCFVMYIGDIFVRGAGYFSSTALLFMASLWWLAGETAGDTRGETTFYLEEDPSSGQWLSSSGESVTQGRRA